MNEKQMIVGMNKVMITETNKYSYEKMTESITI